MPKVIFNGEEGDAFTNETGKVLYQFHASLSNTCGVCLSYHLAISSYWPIPIHRNCACHQTFIAPGATAEPWVDYRKILDEMSPAQQREAIGASNYKLLTEGVVKWDDIVTNTRVRSLREVVAREKLTIPDLKSVGVRDDVAKAAWSSVHTTGHEAAAAHRKILVENLTKAGVSPQQIKQGFSRGIAARVTLVKPHGPGGGGATAGPFTPIEPLIEYLRLDAEKVKAAIKRAEEEKRRKEEEGGDAAE
jgi:hypothetical protein